MLTASQAAPAANRPERASPYEILFSPTRGRWLLIDATGYSEHETLQEAMLQRELLERMLERAKSRAGVAQ